MPDPIWRHTGPVQAENGCFWLEPQTIPADLQATFDGELLLHQGDGRVAILTGIQYGQVQVTIELWLAAPAGAPSEWEEHESLTVAWTPECEAIQLRIDDEGEVVEVPIALGATTLTAWCRNRGRAAELDQSGASPEEVDGVVEFLITLHPGN